MQIKRCPKCSTPKLAAEFTRNLARADGLAPYCKSCDRARQRAKTAANRAKNSAPDGRTHFYGDNCQPPHVAPDEFEIVEDPAIEAVFEEDARRREQETARQARLDSDHETLKPSDLGGEYTAPEYDREKKQEYSETMGQFAGSLRELGADPGKLAAYVSLTAEQERRWLNKRLARSQSLAAARELLFVRQFEAMAARIQWPQFVQGYAARSHVPNSASRMQTLVLSDLHVGALLPGYENPVHFDFLTAGRRLAALFLRACDLKPQYRDRTILNLCLNGDIIEGMLEHNDRDNAALAEQMVAVSYMLHLGIAYAASAYPGVEVWCEPGNHGRNKLRHPGRATSSKWDNHETAIYKLLALRCSPLKNVRFHIPRAPAVVLPLFDHNALITHGDSELKLKSPSASGGKKSWHDALDFVNAPITADAGAPLRYGAPISLLIAGHFHDPEVMYFNRGVGIANGCMVPDSGYARAAGYESVCGQFVFESVKGHPFGDSRFLRVGPADDRDSALDKIIPPFDFDAIG